jgi:RNA polymerase sigma-70 factor (ECF subfamily)
VVGFGASCSGADGDGSVRTTTSAVDRSRRMAGQQDSFSGLEDREAFRSFYREALPRVYGYLLNRCGRDRAIAEDLTQETFMAGIREIRKQTTVRDPASWILGIARHRLLDHYRARERERRRLAAVANTEMRLSDLVEWTSDDLSRERAAGALAAVPGPQRAALVLRYVDGLSVPEAAAAIGKSIHATESLLMRGKQSFKRAYEEASGA